MRISSLLEAPERFVALMYQDKALELKNLKRIVQQPKVLFKIDKLEELDLGRNRRITLVYYKYNEQGFMKGFC